MKKLSSVLIVFFQLAIAFIVLFIIYIIFALLDMNDVEMLSELGFLIFQPIIGIVLSALTIIICIILGLPIRLIPKIYEWWIHKPFIIFAGILVGVILLLLSLNSNFKETTKIIIDNEERIKYIPNFILAITGWFLIAFCLLHFYPKVIIDWIRKRIVKPSSPYLRPNAKI